MPVIRRIHEAAFGGRLETGIVDALRSAGAITLSMVGVIGGEEVATGEAAEPTPPTISTWGALDRNEPSGEARPRITGGEVIGHALVSPVTVVTNGPDLPLLGLAPVAVLPEYQGQGMGTLLIEACLEQLRQSGAVGVVVVGDPAYYSRFGFIPAARWGLRCEMEVPEGAFMALELSPGRLAGISGIVRYRREFTEAARLK